MSLRLLPRAHRVRVLEVDKRLLEVIESNSGRLGEPLFEGSRTLLAIIAENLYKQGKACLGQSRLLVW